MHLQFLQLLKTRAQQLRYFYVYGYRHPITKVWTYIGKGRTKDYYDRKSKHLDYARRIEYNARDYPNPHLINWIRLLLREGLSPEIILLREGMSNEHAYKYEAELVSRIGRDLIATGTLFNLDSGGLGGKQLSDETRRKVSLSNQGKHDVSVETRLKQSAARKGKPAFMKGKHFPLEFGMKISQAKKGKPAWNKGKTKESPESEETKLRKSKSAKAAWIRRRGGESACSC